MTKISTEHLARTAFVYVRQSTSDQLLNNHEELSPNFGDGVKDQAAAWA